MNWFGCEHFLVAGVRLTFWSECVGYWITFELLSCVWKRLDGARYWLDGDEY